MVAAEDVIKRLQEMADPTGLGGMAHFGISVKGSLGHISVPSLRKLARELGKSHELAGQLWSSGSHEARLLACMVDEPKLVTEGQMEHWVRDFDSWDVCDCCCGDLFDKTPFSYAKALEWSRREEEFVKRTAFSLMAYLAVHDKRAPDEKFTQFLPVISREALDGRNFVKKAVNWALRQIGKRNRELNRAAIETAQEIKAQGTGSARWIATDALRELTGDAVQQKLDINKP